MHPMDGLMWCQSNVKRVLKKASDDPSNQSLARLVEAAKMRVFVPNISLKSLWTCAMSCVNVVVQRKRIVDSLAAASYGAPNARKMGLRT